MEEIKILTASVEEEKEKKAHGKFTHLPCQNIYWIFKQMQQNRT